MNDECRIVTFGSIAESTPEGLYLMDRIRMREQEMCENPFYSELIRREEEYFLFGDLA